MRGEMTGTMTGIADETRKKSGINSPDFLFLPNPSNTMAKITDV